MKIAVRYNTRSGNTKKIADAIAASVGVPALDVSSSLEEKVDILFLGSSVYAGGVDEQVKVFIEKNADNIGKIVNFSTAAISRSTYNQVSKIAAENGVDMEAEDFHCRGSFMIMHRNRPNEEDLKRASAFAKRFIK